MNASAVLHGPLGPMTLRESGGQIIALDWGAGENIGDAALLREACRPLTAYFAAQLTRFDLPLAQSVSDKSGYRFSRQTRVKAGILARSGDDGIAGQSLWHRLSPAGPPRHRSHRFRADPDLRRLGPRSGRPAQAAGQACAANPIAILIPCHRVLGAGSLGGYSAKGGVETKVFLLRLEGSASLLL